MLINTFNKFDYSLSPKDGYTIFLLIEVFDEESGTMLKFKVFFKSKNDLKLFKQTIKKTFPSVKLTEKNEKSENKNSKNY